MAQAVWTLAAIGITAGAARACETPVSVCETAKPSSLALIRQGRPAAVYVDAKADPAVRHAAEALGGDLALVAGAAQPEPIKDLSRATGPTVIVGVLGASPVIDGLVRAGKLRVGDLPGQWEGFRQVVVERPTPKLARALVIVGSDRRGAAYGAYDLSERIGVSPWTWWADAPVTRKSDLFVTAGARADHPRVRYRGFFINDEDPAFSGWAKRKFGGVNADAYAHVFDLLLRLKGNYLWPAMWAPKAFNDDDPRSKVIADQMGVVMGSSHHEPMTRAQDEWHRHTEQGVTGGKWDYATNAENLRTFWRGGIERMMSKGDGTPYESLVTVGMRGDGDEPMSEGAATQLLEKVVADQRRIIAEVTGKPADQTPQVWALYKEVQDYYDHGMRVPDDVTLLFSDDNWGQIRRLPVAGKDKLPRAGGYGVYYHFDYVGGPRNYKWINTNQIAKVWQQMDLAYRRGARNLWIVNVGDIKPMEYPLSFFLRQAWNPEAMTPAALAAFPRQWGAETLGAELGPEVGDILETYGTLASRKKPELLDQDSFPLGPDGGAALDGGTFGAIVDRWRALVERVEAVKARLRPDQRDAYFQLVEYPVLAFANLYEMYYATAWNRRLSSRNDPRANVFADTVETTFKRDAELTAQYHAINGGKWAGMMNQVHMSYVIWNDPTKQSMPSVTRVAADTPLDRLAAKVTFARTSTPPPGLVIVDAAQFERAVGGRGLTWTAIPNLGLGTAMIATPQGRPATTPADGVRLEYGIQVDREGPARVRLRLAPTLDTTGGKGLAIGVSVDDGPVQVLTSALVPTPGAASTPEQAAWIEAVKDHGHTLEASLPSLSVGRHQLKIWRLDDNVVLERVEVDTR
ncbi:glycosyl hydrolase 115 family protein [uncultured Caulobacter sp.]|uniref:glycosyl hydrolase 115 family protein n=1 Tax=uncultured Caulobacter sp. TaxID=158749 RepID=UPI0026260385|nr:glycosyl hydrolase 115 family protein [uncultured Caulobacter sp.]